MTLQNGLIHRGKAYLWTDTALWDASTGTPIGTVSKAFSGVTWPWAGVLSGLMLPNEPYRVQTLIAEANPRDPAELIEATRSALRLEAMAGRHCRVLLAFPCPDYGARMFMIAADAMPFAAPLEPYETVEYMSSGNGSPWAAKFAGKDLTPAMMRKFIDHQIEHPGETVLGWNGHNIGGNIIETRVTAKGAKNFLVRAVDRQSADAERSEI
jgi:hypothetical protein